MKIRPIGGRPKIIAVDFDGTCVTHEFPDVGRDIGAAPVLKDLVAAGHSLILWTMRDGSHLTPAVDWFARNSIPLFGVNSNPDQHWSRSPKAFAHVYIDDMALGAPLLLGRTGERPFINWDEVRRVLLP